MGGYTRWMRLLTSNSMRPLFVHRYYLNRGCHFNVNVKKSQLVKISIPSQESRSSFHLFCGVHLVKANKVPIADSTVIELLDEDGTNLGKKTKKEAAEIAESRNLKSVRISKSAERIIYQLMPPETVSEMKDNKPESRQESKGKGKQKQPKTLTIGNTIAQNELEFRLKSLHKWLDQGRSVSIVIKKRRETDDKETMQVLRMIEGSVGNKAIFKELSNNDFMMRGTLAPEIQTENTKTKVPPLFKTKELQKMRREELDKTKTSKENAQSNVTEDKTE